MKRYLTLLTACLLSLGLIGCGQQGALYFPQPQDETTPAAQSNQALPTNTP